MACNDQVNETFAKAKSDFFKGLKDPKLRSQLQSVTTIDGIWAFVNQLQREQSQNKRLLGLNRIRPFVERLGEYAGVIEVFTQVKPDVIALIWGPIKLLLQISSNLVKSFDAILEVMKTLGPVLPMFSQLTRLFETNDRMKYVLSLFFEDILDFYQVSLNFFNLGSMNTLHLYGVVD